MCRSRSTGTETRRCPSCTGYPAVARANANRRQGRQARRKVVDHLRGRGLLCTAEVVLGSPPSMLAEFMASAGIDVAVLGDTPMPGTGPSAASAKRALDSVKSEIAAARKKARSRRLAAVSPGNGVVESKDAEAGGAASARLAQTLAKVSAAAHAQAKGVPNCGTNLSVITKWEKAAEVVFAEGGSKAQCRQACAEAEMLCKGCPLLNSCAQNAKDSGYSGVAGGRIFVNGRNRLTPSRADRIVA